LFNLVLALNVIRKEIARNANIAVGDHEVRAKEPDEELDNFGIRVREADCVPMLRTFCPVEHAACDV
jgi:hypothetical protein